MRAIFRESLIENLIILAIILIIALLIAPDSIISIGKFKTQTTKIIAWLILVLILIILAVKKKWIG